MRRIGWFLLCLVTVFVTAGAVGEERITRLFGSEYDFWDADWSPDGKNLALAGKNHNQSAEKARIWLYTSGAEKPFLWTNTADYCDDWPRWAPDGKRIALVRRENQPNRGTCVWWKDVETGAGRRLTKGPDDRQPNWSPDGQAIVFRRGLTPQQSALAVLDTATGKVALLPVPAGLVGEPFWGSDGTIYYTRYRLMKRETKVGGQPHTVEVIGGGAIWRYHPSTGQGGPLLDEELDFRMPALSPDGRWLAFYGQQDGPQPTLSSIPDPTTWALYLRDQNTGKTNVAVTNVALTGGPPVWSRDGSTVIFYSLRAKVPALWMCTVTHFTVVKE